MEYEEHQIRDLFALSERDFSSSRIPQFNSTYKFRKYLNVIPLLAVAAMLFLLQNYYGASISTSIYESVTGLYENYIDGFGKIAWK